VPRHSLPGCMKGRKWDLMADALKPRDRTSVLSLQASSKPGTSTWNMDDPAQHSTETLQNAI